GPIIAANETASQIEVNCDGLGTPTTSLKNGCRKNTTAATPVVTIIRVKITQPKSPVQRGRRNSWTDASSGPRGFTATGRRPSVWAAHRTGINETLSTTAITSKLSRVWCTAA